jgi:hypothetical protein
MGGAAALDAGRDATIAGPRSSARGIDNGGGGAARRDIAGTSETGRPTATCEERGKADAIGGDA